MWIRSIRKATETLTPRALVTRTSANSMAAALVLDTEKIIDLAEQPVPLLPAGAPQHTAKLLAH